MENKLYTDPQLCEILSCSRSTVYRYVSEDRIGYIRRVRTLLFPEKDVKEFLERFHITARQQSI